MTPSNDAAQALVTRVLDMGIDGVGFMTGASQIADEHRRSCADAEQAIDRLIASHARIVAASGFATGLGGFVTLPITVPTDLAVLYAYSARCAAGVAHLRGYDVHTDEVRSMVLLSLLGSAGAAVLSEMGVQIAQKSAMAALKKLPGRVLIEINKKVGFRLLTKFGEKGVVNLVKFVPLAGAPVGAAINVTTMRSVGSYAKRNFPQATLPVDVP